jgi:hypothetical protein
MVSAVEHAGSRPDAAWGAVLSMALCAALDGLSIQATFIGSLALAVLSIALIGNGQRLLKPE